MAVEYLLPHIFQRIRLDLLDALKRQDWETVRALDKRMGALMEAGLSAPNADRKALSRELSLNMRVYKHILRHTEQLGILPDRL